MTNRKILYGYHIKNGALTIVPAEAETVKRVFTSYIAGASYIQISDALNHDRVPFSGESPVWNKHKVKRILENPRYAGSRGYPALIDEETFQTAQRVIQSRRNNNAGAKTERPALKIRPYLRCQSCGNRLRRLAGKNRKADTLYLKCDSCGALITIPDSELLDKIMKQTEEHNAPAEIEYTPTDTVIRLTNAVNRGLERSDNPEEILSLILQGISARYDCWSRDPSSNSGNTPIEKDWKFFSRTVSFISVASDRQVTIHFKNRNNMGSEEYGTGGTGTAGAYYPCQTQTDGGSRDGGREKTGGGVLPRQYGQ